MDKNAICEAMYALPGGVVEKRRKPMLIPGLLLVVGVALIILNSRFGTMISNDLSSAVVFIGGSVTLIGMITLAARVFGSNGVPYHKQNHCYLHYDELYFERGVRGEMLQAVAHGGVEPLLSIKRSNVPALTVALYRTPDNRFAAMQAFEYTDLEYRPLTDLKIVGQ